MVHTQTPQEQVGDAILDEQPDNRCCARTCVDLDGALLLAHAVSCAGGLAVVVVQSLEVLEPVGKEREHGGDQQGRGQAQVVSLVQVTALGGSGSVNGCHQRPGPRGQGAASPRLLGASWQPGRRPPPPQRTADAVGPGKTDADQVLQSAPPLSAGPKGALRGGQKQLRLQLQQTLRHCSPRAGGAAGRVHV